MSPLFNFTSGNPSNLVAGQTANMADIQGPLTDLRAGINGNLDEVNVPNLTAAFTTYKRLARTATLIGSAVAAGTYLTQMTNVTGNLGFGAASAGTLIHVIDLDPAPYNANSRTTRLSLRAAVITNAVAPAITFTPGLYPVATFGGASSVEPFIATLGTVITGSTAPIATPPASARTAVVSADFNFPAAGPYVIAVPTSATTAAGAMTHVFATLEMRQV